MFILLGNTLVTVTCKGCDRDDQMNVQNQYEREKQIFNLMDHKNLKQCGLLHQIIVYCTKSIELYFGLAFRNVKKYQSKNMILHFGLVFLKS